MFLFEKLNFAAKTNHFNDASHMAGSFCLMINNILSMKSTRIHASLE
jgi:hypothetical protein